MRIFVDNEAPAVDALYAGPLRRPLSADSEFFDAGNTNRALLCKVSVFAIAKGGGDPMDFEEDRQQHHLYKCMFRDCSATFSSLKRHEAHYETSHRNRCSACGRTFPTHRLLDLHLSETHDSFFKAMAERRPMYVCLVEGCSDVFESSARRHEHLVVAHRYPQTFDFTRPSYSRKKARARTSKHDEERKGSDAQITGSGRKAKRSTKEPDSGIKNELNPPLARAGPPLAGNEKNAAVYPSATFPADNLPQRRQHSRPKAFPQADDRIDVDQQLKLDGSVTREDFSDDCAIGEIGVVSTKAGGYMALSGERSRHAGRSGDMDELISGMSRLLVPRHLRLGKSGRQGESAS